MLMLMSAVAQAAIFNVNTNNDLVDMDPNDGACLTSEDNCTLRAAIMQANETASLDVIILPADDYTLKLTWSAGADDDAYGDLDVEQPLAITGPASTRT